MSLDKIKQVKLAQVKVNKANPRTITTANFQKLVTSILVFPKMQMIRPIVVDNLMQALGGNMRCQALHTIAAMTADQIASRLNASADYARKTAGEKNALINWWGKWLEKPYAYIIDASELSEDERKQFIIKDNASSGQWDYDALANKWDSRNLDDWGIPVWNATPAAFAPLGGASPSAVRPTPTEPDASEDDGSGVFPTTDSSGGLPAELQGKDITPDILPKIVGSDEVALERIIITYTKERLPELLNLLGMPSIDKVVYRLEEILPNEEG